MNSFFFDLDGTLIDSMAIYAEEATKDNFIIDEEHDQYCLRCWPFTPSMEILSRWFTAAWKQWQRVRPIDQYVEQFLRILYTYNDTYFKEACPPIKVITSRRLVKGAYYGSMMSLRNVFQGIEFSLDFSNEKHITGTGLRIAVEDRRETAMQLQRHGFQVFLLEKPYNKLNPKQYYDLENLLSEKDFSFDQIKGSTIFKFKSYKSLIDERVIDFFINY